MRTVAIAHNCSVRFSCSLCGEDSTPAIDVTGRLLTDDDWIVANEICPACTEAGPHGAAERMRQLADRLRQQAETIEKVANDVENITEWATLEDWGRARLRLDADIRDIEESKVSAWVEEHLPSWLEHVRSFSEVKAVMAGEA